MIDRGKAWGAPGRLPADAPRIGSDQALAAAVAEGIRHARVTAGDLARTLGVTDRSLERPEQMLLPVDVLRVELADGSRRLAVAHVVLWRRGRPRLAVMNAAFIGSWNLAPRAHPGDGKADRIQLGLTTIDWLKARRRLPTGSHIPHPDISARSGTSFDISADIGGRWRLDGQSAGPDAVRRVEAVSGLLCVGV